MVSREELYKWLKISGMLSFIPIILLTGVFAGYFVGEYLKSKFKLSPSISFICISIGVASSIMESIRIIKQVLKIDKKV